MTPSSLLSYLLFTLINVRNTLCQGPSPPIAPIARLPPRAPPVPAPPIAPIAAIPQFPQTPPQMMPPGMMPPVMSPPGMSPPGLMPPGVIPPIMPQIPIPQRPIPQRPLLITVPTRPRVEGFWGQDCTPAQGDYPEACPNPATELLAPGGKIECIHNFDCCTCKAMICGNNIEPCSDLICNGDSGCYGVRDIQLNGGESGVNINCNGDVSCQKTGIVGTNVASILCSGDNSCSYSIFNLKCLPLNGCVLECVGDSSCEADPLIPSLTAKYTIDNSYGMSCSARACKYATFDLKTNLGGSIICGASEACLGSKITANNIINIMCGGRHSCKDANIVIINPQNYFTLSCQSSHSCLGLKLEIIITDPLIETFRAISCGAMNACENAQITITKQTRGASSTVSSTTSFNGITGTGSNSLTINELACGGFRACFNTHFYLTPNIVFDQCGCAGGMTQSCQGLIGIDSCAQGLYKIECVGISCQGKTEEITNPKDYFELICSDSNSCRGYTLTIRITDSINAPTILNGVVCGAPNACIGMRINIINEKSNSANSPILIANGILCGTTNSCKDAIIVTHNADIPYIGCGDITSCVGCQQWTNMRYNACDNPAISAAV